MHLAHRPRPSALLRSVIAAAVLGGAVGCDGDGTVLRLASGTAVADLVGSDSAVVAIYDPAACMSCDNLLPDWFRWAETHPRRFALVLSREPTPEERKRIILRRVTPQGVLRRGFAFRRWTSAGVYYALFVHGHLDWVRPSSAYRTPVAIQEVVQRWFNEEGTVRRDSTLAGTRASQPLADVKRP